MKELNLNVERWSLLDSIIDHAEARPQSVDVLNLADDISNANIFAESHFSEDIGFWNPKPNAS